MALPESALTASPSRIAREEAEQDSFPTDILTQDWRDFLDSSQGNAGRQSTMSSRLAPVNPGPPRPNGQLQDELSAAITTESCASAAIPLFLCWVCGTELDTPRAVLCEGCSFAPHGDPDMDACIQCFNLCEEQARILRLAARGRNVFYTGAAGTGKSQVLRALVKYYSAKRVVTDVLSPTGIAALNVNGKTIHTYAGWSGKSKEFPIARLERNAGKDRNFRRLSRTEVLIIDEISMVSNFTLTRLDRIMRAARHVSRPFGGAQIICTGDFFQIPPVKPFETCLTCGKRMSRMERVSEVGCNEHGSFREEDKWAFASNVWEESAFVSVNLSRIHRQMDPVFSAILNKVRVGDPLSSHEDKLLRDHETTETDYRSVKICPKREQVSNENVRMLDKLEGPEYRFQCVDGGYWNEEMHPELEECWARMPPGDNTCPFVAYCSEESDRHRLDDVARLKVGMPVILLTNLDLEQGLANGSRGEVVAFVDLEERELSEHVEWLRVRNHGQHQADQIKLFVERAADKCLPLVRFDNGHERTIYPHCEIQELGVVLEDATQERFSVRSRTQFPLAPGWAITTHKSQGMTLDQATVNLSTAFEAGMSYVALSRVRGLGGMRVIDLATGRATRADETVKRFTWETFGRETTGAVIDSPLEA